MAGEVFEKRLLLFFVGLIYFSCMSDVKTSIKELSKNFEEVEVSLDVPKKKKRIVILESESSVEGFWDDNEKARVVMQELGDLKKEIEKIESLSKQIKDLEELAGEDGLTEELEGEVKKVEKILSAFTLTSFLSGKYDKKNAIFSIHAGQGGTEAMDWTNMLFRMYQRYFEKKDWKHEVIEISSGEEAGLKSVTFKVTGNYAYGYLKNESGTHRLVRQSPFNADKLRQTSFASVEVLPELADVDLPDIEIRDDDLEWQFFRSSGKGGQNVNKVSTAVRLSHKPSGIVVTSQAERQQEKNRKLAMDLLRSRLWLLEEARAKAEKKDIKGDYRPASWGTQIRSYVLHPYKMVKDLRTKVEVGDTESVLDGDLDEFIEAEIKISGK